MTKRSWSGLVISCVLMMSWAAAAAMDMSPVRFDTAYTPLFGGDNLVRSPDGRTVLKLDRFTGSGFVSKSAYHHGFFSASIKLPRDYTAGVVVAFYGLGVKLVGSEILSERGFEIWMAMTKAKGNLSNGDVFPGKHDELDFELLGNRRGHAWHVQTNMYGNGSTGRGREERYLLPFDPTAAPHSYAIAWTPAAVIFYVDGIPIRELVRCSGADYPAKPMSVYATIWDGSAWATDGGRYKVDYAYAPFTAVFSNLVVTGASSTDDIYCGLECAAAAVGLMTSEVAVMTPAKRGAMRQFRSRHLTYSACHDRVRYNGGVVFPECDDSDRDNFHAWGESKRVITYAAAGGVRVD
uniref:Xyloglucan endotransglucosylase/hydrolase n=1 Tax=Oryza punctata TaxID=4537 RepID=A0A0E0MB66_ORYPU